MFWTRHIGCSTGTHNHFLVIMCCCYVSFFVCLFFALLAFFFYFFWGGGGVVCLFGFFVAVAFAIELNCCGVHNIIANFITANQ